jgi:hypothetical protein
MNIRTALLILMLSSVSWHAKSDPYRDWANEVNKATKGLEICSREYAKAIQDRELMTYAQRTCGTMKGLFDTTMLTVRSNVNGIDDVLASFHRLGNAAFDEMKPKQNESPLTYLDRELKARLLVSKMQLQLTALDGGH